MYNSKGICGLGYKSRDTSVYVAGTKVIDPAYKHWCNMIHRCYGTNNNKTYANCGVRSDWFEYEEFRYWFYGRTYKTGFEVDKDILGDGNLYSPDTCCLVDKKLNNFFVGFRKSYKNSNFGSKSVVSGRTIYTAYCRNPITGIRERLGRFDTEAFAKEIWLKRKREIARELMILTDDDRVKKALSYI